jgi:hypothetical protein
MATLSNCHDCGAEPGQTHIRGCDVERCSACGDQRLQCDTGNGACANVNGVVHDSLFARWTGIWPGAGECAALGYYTVWDPNGVGKPEMNYGHIQVPPGTRGATEDLNRLYKEGLHKIFFVKPRHLSVN